MSNREGNPMRDNKWFDVARMLRILMFAGLGVWVTGCRPANDEVTISGTVTLEGEQLESGVITFTPRDGATHVSGGIIEDGAYRVSVLPGEKIVLIRGLKRVADRTVTDEVSGVTYPVSDWARVTPAEYESAESPLRADVTSDGEMFDFELKRQFSD